MKNIKLALVSVSVLFLMTAKNLNAQLNIGGIKTKNPTFNSTIMEPTTGSTQIGQPLASNSGNYTIITIAGSGSVNGGYKDAPGKEAFFNAPLDIAVDGNGNLYVADFTNYCIRKITKDGVVTTLVGYNETEKSGQSGNPARFYGPTGIWISAEDAIYVADKNSHTIRKITTSGVASFVCGSVAGYLDGSLSKAQFHQPNDMAIDSKGNLFICDGYNNCIRKISENQVTTFAGGEFGYKDDVGQNAQFMNPFVIAIDANDNIYLAEFNRIRKITPAGVVTTFAGNIDMQERKDGTGTNAYFRAIQSITISPSGKLYVIDKSFPDAAIRMITLDGQVTTIAGGDQWRHSDDSESEAQLRLGDGPTDKFYPSYGAIGICVDKDETIYFCDQLFNCVRKISKQ